MTDAKSVRVKVVDERGVGIPGAFVSILRSTVAFPEIALVTDRDGAVQLSLPEGKFVIGANALGKGQGELEIDSSIVDRELVVVLRPND